MGLFQSVYSITLLLPMYPDKPQGLVLSPVNHSVKVIEFTNGFWFEPESTSGFAFLLIVLLLAWGMHPVYIYI